FRVQVPPYLAAAADFPSAARYISVQARKQATKRGGNALQLNAQVDWLILAGRYREAIALILKKGPKSFAPEGSSVVDYWTAFRMRPEVIRLRTAMLLYLAGDDRKAAKALESLN